MDELYKLGFFIRGDSNMLIVELKYEKETNENLEVEDEENFHQIDKKFFFDDNDDEIN